MRRAAALCRPLLAALLLGACTKRVPPPPDVATAAVPVAVAPTVDAAPSVREAREDAGSKAIEPPTTWSDPRVVAALAADCDYIPPAHVHGDDEGNSIPPDLFRCTLGFEQSCAFDPCTIPGDRCTNTCGKSCRSCGGTCSTRCKACKKDCTDDACKQACATSCADCKETCNRTMDRCTSGTCTPVYTSCRDSMRALGAKCDVQCDALMACRGACSEKGGNFGDCSVDCAAKGDAKYNACAARCKGNDDCVVQCFRTSGCPSDLCNLR